MLGEHGLCVVILLTCHKADVFKSICQEIMVFKFALKQIKRWALVIVHILKFPNILVNGSVDLPVVLRWLVVVLQWCARVL